MQISPFPSVLLFRQTVCQYLHVRITQLHFWVHVGRCPHGYKRKVSCPKIKHIDPVQHLNMSVSIRSSSSKHYIRLFYLAYTIRRVNNSNSNSNSKKQHIILFLKTNTSVRSSLVMSDYVSYSVPRPIHRPMHRSIYRSLLDRPSTHTRLTCRSTVDRESTDVLVELPLMSAEVSTVTISGAYRSSTGGISVNYPRNVGRVAFDSRGRVCRYNLPIYRPILEDW